MCSLTPDQCGASTRCTKDALSQPCCKSVSSFLAELKDYVVRPGRESALGQLVAARKIQENFYPTLTLTHERELVLCFDFGINSGLLPE